SDAQRDYANQVAQSLQQEGFRAEVDTSGERLGKQIRTAELEKIPVISVIGQREMDAQTIGVRTRQSGDLGALTVPEVIEKLKDAIAQKTTI
ncbi:MAG: His/Gly/Thr/Pro-type tRNA ligase C-terminal domain-containing protein, partial [Cyanobacteria bacterium J06627_15]